MKKYDVVVIGELNMDIILDKNNSFPELGKEILSGQMKMTLGSSSAICASNLSALGNKVAFIGKTGNDAMGEMVLNELNKSNVITTAVVRDDQYPTGTTVVLNYGDERAMITHQGVIEYFAFEDVDWELVKQARHLHLSSFFIQPGLRKNMPEIFSKAKSLGLTISFDPQWDPEENWDIDLDLLLPLVDIFLPNEKEFLAMTKTGSIEAGISGISARACIVIKQGERGSTLRAEGEPIFMPAFFNKDVVDSVGAGDSFNAGFIHQFLKGLTLNECQEFGNLMGALNTTAAGGTTAFTETNTIMERATQKFGYSKSIRKKDENN